MSKSYDENTLRKVYDALDHAGLTPEQSIDAVIALQNKGILFRERVEESVAALYETLPVQKWAMQFTGGAENATAVINWVLASLGTARYHEPMEIWPEAVHIDTLEGTMAASVGDWIIRGVNDEFYPCKPDIFAKTYKKVETQ